MSSSSSNRAVVQTRFPPAEACSCEASLDLVHRSLPRASPGTVVIRLTARSVNPNDLTNIRDRKLQSFHEANYPPVIDSEGCGRVFEVPEPFHSIVTLPWKSAGSNILRAESLDCESSVSVIAVASWKILKPEPSVQPAFNLGMSICDSEGCGRIFLEVSLAGNAIPSLRFLEINGQQYPKVAGLDFSIVCRRWNVMSA